MLKRITDRNIWLVCLAIFLLGLAYGIAIALLALFLDAAGFGKASIGTLAAWFAGGIVALSLPMGRFIDRFSARWTLVASLLTYAVAVTAFPYLSSSFPALAAIRFLDGAASVGIWVSCETILLHRAERHQKAFVMSVYTICMAIGYILGPIASRAIVAFAPMYLAFVMAGIIAAAAGLLVWWRLDPDPVIEPSPTDAPVAYDSTDLAIAPITASAAESAHRDTRHVPHASGTGPDAPSLSLSNLLWRIKSSCFATFSYGYFQASVVLFLPLFLIESKGVAPAATIMLPAYFAAGLLLFTNIGGRLGDRFGHLMVMRTLAAVAVPAIAGFALLDNFAVMCFAVFCGGAALGSISPLALALQGLVVPDRDFARANAYYNAFYAAGMLIGPPISSFIFIHVSGAAMLYHLAGMWAAFVLFAAIFYRDDPRVRYKRRVRQAAASPREAKPASRTA